MAKRSLLSERTSYKECIKKPTWETVKKVVRCETSAEVPMRYSLFWDLKNL